MCTPLLKITRHYSRIGKAEENENKMWYILMLVFSVIFYLCSLVGIVLLYVYFTEVSRIKTSLSPILSP